jgi:hypothetical protein
MRAVSRPAVSCISAVECPNSEHSLHDLQGSPVAQSPMHCACAQPISISRSLYVIRQFLSAAYLYQAVQKCPIFRLSRSRRCGCPCSLQGAQCSVLIIRTFFQPCSYHLSYSFYPLLFTYIKIQSWRLMHTLPQTQPNICNYMFYCIIKLVLHSTLTVICSL